MTANWFDLLSDGESPAQWANKIKSGHRLAWEQTLHNLAGSSETALSLGCGIGNVCAPLAMKGVRTHGIDLSEDNIRFARELYAALPAKGDFRVGSITEPLPFGDGSIDFVSACTVLQFFDDDAIIFILREALRVARKRVVVILPNSMCLSYRIGRFHLQRNGRWPWGKERSFASLRTHFAKAGALKAPKEFTVAPRHALNFLGMRGSGLFKRSIRRVFGASDSPNPAPLRQGYMLISVLDK